MDDAPITHTDGLGVLQETADTAPVNASARHAAPYPSRPGTGLEWVPRALAKGVLGQDEIVSSTNTAAKIALTVTRIVLNSAAGAVVGIALAPGHDKRVKYGIVGGLLGLFLGPVGIGGQALYVLAKE
jgi:hypothetical protein